VLLCLIWPAAIWTVHSCWSNGSTGLLAHENLQQQAVLDGISHVLRANTGSTNIFNEVQYGVQRCLV
jgi:hypothetical protein